MCDWIAYFISSAFSYWYHNGSRPGEESDANSSRETTSDGDSECENDRGASNSRGSWGLAGRNSPPMGSSTGRDDVSNPPGLLVFEYFERELPFHREPLADKASTISYSRALASLVCFCVFAHI